MLVLAHRGYHAGLPENTMGAFEAALSLGVDGIETDVRSSADGKAVIVHDRVIHGVRRVDALTHAELEAGIGHPVPLLADILGAFPVPFWNIEIKTPAAWLAAKPVLAEYHRKRRLLVTSFRHDVIASCADSLDVDCGLLVAHRPLDVEAMMVACASRRRINSVVWDYNVVDEAVLDTVAAAGWRNYVYGAVTPEEHRHCACMGPAGLITDYPAHVQRRELP